MPSTFDQTITDSLPGAGTHTLSFRPGTTGTITVDSRIPYPVRQPPGEPLYDFSVEILRPASATPVARGQTKKGETALAFSYSVTAADLAAAGDWTCRISNASGAQSALLTTLTYPTGWPIRTASFDIPLINLILAEALKVAQPKVHLQSSTDPNDKECSVSWSADAQALLGPPIAFYLGPQSGPLWTNYRVVSLDTQSITASMQLVAPPTLELAITFETSGVELQGANKATPDIDIKSLSATGTVLFDGTVTMQFTASARTDDGGIDESSTVAGDFASALEGKVSKPVVRGYLDKVFAGLMRLDEGAVITGYDVVNQAVIVSYAAPPPSMPVHQATSIAVARL